MPRPRQRLHDRALFGQGGTPAYQRHIDAAKQGLLSEAEIDVALKRMLRIRFELGLFGSRGHAWSTIRARRYGVSVGGGQPDTGAPAVVGGRSTSRVSARCPDRISLSAVRRSGSGARSRA
jgi:hypothetical protein